MAAASERNGVLNAHIASVLNAESHKVEDCVPSTGLFGVAPWASHAADDAVHQRSTSGHFAAILGLWAVGQAHPIHPTPQRGGGAGKLRRAAVSSGELRRAAASSGKLGRAAASSGEALKTRTRRFWRDEKPGPGGF